MLGLKEKKVSSKKYQMKEMQFKKYCKPDKIV